MGKSAQPHYSSGKCKLNPRDNKTHTYQTIPSVVEDVKHLALSMSALSSVNWHNYLGKVLLSIRDNHTLVSHTRPPEMYAHTHQETSRQRS